MPSPIRRVDPTARWTPLSCHQCGHGHLRAHPAFIDGPWYCEKCGRKTTTTDLPATQPTTRVETIGTVLHTAAHG